MEAQGCVLDVEVDHGGAGNLAEEGFVFLLPHGGDVRETIVLVDRVRVGVGGVEASGEDVDDGDGVPVAKPGTNGESERECGVVAVGGENDDSETLLRRCSGCICSAAWSSSRGTPEAG